jgi:8-amino-7-oxononanoate synthase
VNLDDEVRAELAALEAAHRLRVPRVVDGPQGVVVRVDGREVISFASNDYLGLAGDKRITDAAAESLARDGMGAGASRLVVGNHREHVELEAAVADWMRRPGVRLFNSGYAANIGVITTLVGAGDVVFSDELNHASIIDGCRLSRARIEVFPHRDVAALDAGLARSSGRRKLVVTESLFSMDGDDPDLVGMAEVCKRHGAALLVDEAHAIGVAGDEGRGLCAAVGVVPDVLVGTFGKALGSFGAFAVSSENVAALLWNRARPLVFSTGLPPSVASGNRTAVKIVRDSDSLRCNLHARARQLRMQTNVGGASASPIAPLVVGDDAAVMRKTEELLGKGLCVQGIRPPTVPEGTARLRISLSAAHTEEHVARLAAALS